jgi:ABC-type multidrug transport system fused ATPase/permease subunit
LGVSEKRIRDVGRIADETILDEKKTLILAGINRFIVEVVFAFGAVAILLILYSQFISGKTSLSLCAAAFAGFILLAKQIRSMTNGIIEVRNIVGASSHIINFLSHPKDSSLEGTRQGPSKVLNISIEGVSFSYNNNTIVLQDSNMTFNRGQVSGIVGISGAGKSTLVDLLLRLRLPSRGRILVNGTNMTEFSEEWIRKTFAFVDQEPFLFNTTIRENLLLARPTLRDHDLKAALKAASAMDFVTALPKGFDSLVGEGGCLLSVGQKQRIALARALVSDPSVLVLDEITSAIDAENEKIILNALCELAPDMIIILISHKDKILACCDRIYRLEDGISHLVKG